MVSRWMESGLAERNGLVVMAERDWAVVELGSGGREETEAAEGGIMMLSQVVEPGLAETECRVVGMGGGWGEHGVQRKWLSGRRVEGGGMPCGREGEEGAVESTAPVRSEGSQL